MILGWTQEFPAENAVSTSLLTISVAEFSVFEEIVADHWLSNCLICLLIQKLYTNGICECKKIINEINEVY